MHVGIAYLRWRGKRSRRMRTRNFAYLVRGPCCNKACSWQCIDNLSCEYHVQNHIYDSITYSWITISIHNLMLFIRWCIEIIVLLLLRTPTYLSGAKPGLWAKEKCKKRILRLLRKIIKKSVFEWIGSNVEQGNLIFKKHVIALTTRLKMQYIHYRFNLPGNYIHINWSTDPLS